jgi:hypothetical protein
VWEGAEIRNRIVVAALKGFGKFCRSSVVEGIAALTWAE